MCDISCRDNSALMFVDPQTGLIVIVDGNSTGKREYFGNLACQPPYLQYGFAPR